MDGAVNKRDLSTEKPESLHEKTRGADFNPGVDSAPTRNRASNQREPESGKNRGMWGIQAGVGNGCCQQKRGVGVRNRNIWLPDMDTNHHSRLQRPLSYR